MKTLKVEAEITYDPDFMYGTSNVGYRWFMQEILLGDNFHLFEDDDISDMIGTIKVTKIKGV